VKTIAKPLATRLKLEAEKNAKFSKFSIAIGQFGHEIVSRINIFASGYRILKIKPLPEEEAQTNGISIISEAVVYLISGTIIIVEYFRGERNNALKLKKQAEKDAKFESLLNQRFDKFDEKIVALDDKIRKIDQEIIEREVSPSITT
jgi:hypothetical protein